MLTSTLFRLHRHRGAIFVAVLFAALTSCLDSPGGETDQFLTWDRELDDSAEVFNAFLDQEIRSFLARANERKRPITDANSLTRGLYMHLFQGLHASRVRHWLKNSDAVDRYPDNDVSDLKYQRMSVFRKPAFPFVLPMAQTVRIGGVYCGIDKIGHMFGFGRRYLQVYQRHLDGGMDHDGAVEKVIRWGIQHESSVVGELVDGIFSHGDLEANYQGFRMALAFTQGESPLFYREDDQWRYRGNLDIRDYVTPDFDESYNPNRYAPWRHRRVAPVLTEEYGNAYLSPAVQRRFEGYRANWRPSLSKRIVDAHFNDRGSEAHHRCWTNERGCDGAT